jgi:hypothetical protein
MAVTLFSRTKELAISFVKFQLAIPPAFIGF